MELPLSEVPHVMKEYGDQWWVPFCKWLDNRGWNADHYGSPEWCTENKIEYRQPPTGYSLLSGESPRYPGVWHTVVALDGVCVHDPHVGDRRGVGAVLDYIKLDWVTHED